MSAGEPEAVNVTGDKLEAIHAEFECQSKRFQAAAWPSIESGVLLSVAKVIFLPNLLLGAWLFGKLILNITSYWASWFARGRAEIRLKVLWTLAVDLYLVLWAIGLCLCVVIANWASNLQVDCFRHLFLGAMVFCAGVRLWEIGQLQCVLLSDEFYEPKLEVRALLNTLWHVFEVATCFSIIYLAIHVWAGDKFSLSCDVAFRDSITRPLYFSCVTIATLGYGDMYPETSWGRVAVIAEIFAGLGLLGLVFQRAMATANRDKPQKPKQNNSEQ